MLFSLFFFMTIAILCVSYKFKLPPKVQKFLAFIVVCSCCTYMVD